MPSSERHQVADGERDRMYRELCDGLKKPFPANASVTEAIVWALNYALASDQEAVSKLMATRVDTTVSPSHPLLVVGHHDGRDTLSMIGLLNSIAGHEGMVISRHVDGDDSEGNRTTYGFSSKAKEPPGES